MNIRLLTLWALPVAVLALFGSAQGQKTKPKAVPAVRQTALPSELIKVVATVEKRPITRLDLVRNYIEMDRMVPGQVLAEKYPQLQPEMNVSFRDVSRYLDGQPQSVAETVVRDLMIDSALDAAASRRKIVLPETLVTQELHKQLEIRRKSQDLPEMSDEQIALKFGDRLSRLRKVVRRSLLVDRLVRDDLDTLLGHPVRADDFFQGRIIYIGAEANEGRITEDALEAAKKQLEAMRDEIAAGKKSFVQMAREKSHDPSRSHDGILGPLPRTFMKPELEKALLRLKPGEMTPLLRNQDGYVIFQLEKVGSDIPTEQRERALTACVRIRRRIDDAMARILKNMVWSTTIGTPPEYFRAGSAPETALR